MIVSFANQKGGTGKSTTAVHMTYWLSKRGDVLLVDSDAQQSSSTWLSALNLPYQVISDPEDLFEALPKLAEKYSAVVVDGPGSLSEVTKAILARSDLALVPCQPSGLDLHSSTKILKFIRHAQELRGGMPLAAMFLSRAAKGTILLKEAKQLLKESAFPLLSTTIYQRQCLADAPGQERTVFQLSGAAAKEAAKDYESLFKESLEVLNGGKQA